MNTLTRTTCMAAALALLVIAAGCEKGPVQKAGERVDRALGQEPLLGKGPVEEAGKSVDKAVDDVKK